MSDKKVWLKSDVPPDDLFASFIIEDSSKGNPTRHYLMFCTEFNDVKNKYVLIMYPCIPNGDSMLYTDSCILWSVVFNAETQEAKQDYIISVISAITDVNDMDYPIELQQKFGGDLNELFKSSGET